METVEVIVKIPKDDLKILRQRFSKGAYRASTLEQTIVETILDGTVLPKGHGRLFILDEELAKEFFTSFSFSCQKWISEVGISNATLKVIEADKEVKE